MINTYMNVSAQELIEGCLHPDEEAWWAFYERFGSMLQRALRRALGARAGDASVVDEVMQDVRLYLYEGRIGLAVYEEHPESLDEFFDECVRICVHRYLVRRRRRKQHGGEDGGDRLPELLAEAEVLDQVTIEEFRQLLTPAEDQVFMSVLLGNREKPPGRPAASATERQLVRRILRKWKQFRTGR
jgi:DNA-directed RNA polymerase specialized sigma24 family protein